jgi:hypothetical protein
MTCSLISKRVDMLSRLAGSMEANRRSVTHSPVLLIAYVSKLNQQSAADSCTGSFTSDDGGRTPEKKSPFRPDIEC